MQQKRVLAVVLTGLLVHLMLFVISSITLFQVRQWTEEHRVSHIVEDREELDRKINVADSIILWIIVLQNALFVANAFGLYVYTKKRQQTATTDSSYVQLI